MCIGHNNEMKYSALYDFKFIFSKRPALFSFNPNIQCTGKNIIQKFNEFKFLFLEQVQLIIKKKKYKIFSKLTVKLLGERVG